MAGFNRPEGGWNFVYDGMNTVDAADAIQPTYYPYARNVRGLADRSIRTRPGYSLFSTTPAITTSCPLTNGVEDTAYENTITALGGIEPYTYTIASGSLPPGLSLAASTGIISGTPTLGGLYSFVILVTDAAGGTDAVSCSLYICPSAASTDWIGCLGGSFSVPGDWTQVSSGVISGGLCTITGLGFVRNSVLGGCGSSLNQEVYAVYNGKTNGPAGVHGYFRVGVGCRMVGSTVGSWNGYLMTATMWSGTFSNTCTYTDGSIFLNIIKVVGGTVTPLGPTASVAGPDLTPGIPFQLSVVVEGSGARCVGYLGGTQMLSVLDTTSVLAAGQVGIGCMQTCGGSSPVDVSFNYIKARNL